MEDIPIPSKIDLRYAEKKVIFLICDCSLHKNFSFWKISREQAEEFINCLKYREQYTWNQFANPAQRGNGLTPERPGSDSFNMIDMQNSSLSQFTEKYYFHFRTKNRSIFRIFGYQKEQYFCITHIDRDGIVHHD